MLGSCRAWFAAKIVPAYIRAVMVPPTMKTGFMRSWAPMSEMKLAGKELLVSTTIGYEASDSADQRQKPEALWREVVVDSRACLSSHATMPSRESQFFTRAAHSFQEYRLM